MQHIPSSWKSDEQEKENYGNPAEFVTNFSTVVNTLHLSAMEELSSCKNRKICINALLSFFMLNLL